MAQAGAAAGFDDVMLAMDVVDAARHQDSAVDAELASDARRGDLAARLKAIYAAQGVDVPDRVLDEGLDALDERRLVHRPVLSGIPRLAALAYVRRRKVAAVAIVGSLAAAFLVTAPQAIWHAAVVAPGERAAAELETLFATRLPQELETAARAATLASGDDQSAVRTSAAAADRGRKAIAERDEAVARSSIAELKGVVDAAARKAAAADLLARAKVQIDAAKDVARRPEASAAVAAMATNLAGAAMTGDAARFNGASRDMAALVSRIETPLKVMIVDRSGERSGVWRSRGEGTPRVYYVIVEALDPAGRAVAREVRSVETGRTSTVLKWGVRVDKRVYDGVAKDKQSDGIVDDRDAGEKPAGGLDVRWSIATTGDAITSW